MGLFGESEARTSRQRPTTTLLPFTHSGPKPFNGSQPLRRVVASPSIKRLVRLASFKRRPVTKPRPITAFIQHLPAAGMNHHRQSRSVSTYPARNEGIGFRSNDLPPVYEENLCRASGMVIIQEWNEVNDPADVDDWARLSM